MPKFCAFPHASLDKPGRLGLQWRLPKAISPGSNPRPIPNRPEGESMAAERYTQATARAIARRVFDKYGPQIREAAAVNQVRPEWLAGLTGMENPNCREWPDRRSQRYESGVFANLRALRDHGRTPRGKTSYNGVTVAHVRGTSDEALRALSTSYGQCQVMGYYVLTLFSRPLDEIVPGRYLSHQDANKPPMLGHMRDPALHYFFAAYMLAHDPLLRKYASPVRTGRADGPGEPTVFQQICHIWNSGTEWQGGADNLKTWSPHYLYNCGLVAQEYDFLVRANTPGTEDNAIARFADSVPATEPSAQFPYWQPRQQGLVSEPRETMRPPALAVDPAEFALQGTAAPSTQEPMTEVLGQVLHDPSGDGGQSASAVVEGREDDPLELPEQEDTDPRAPFNPLDFAPDDLPAPTHTPVITNIEEAVVYEGQHPRLGPTTFVIDPERPLPGEEEAMRREGTVFDERVTGPDDEGLLDPSDRSNGPNDEGPKPASAMSDIFRHMAPESGTAFPNVSRIPTPAEDAALKPGWKTTEAQLIALVTTLAALWLIFRPSQASTVNSTAAQIVSLIQNIGPIITVGALVWNFTTSRGKTKSNALWANAAAQISNPAPMLAAQGLFGGKLDKVLDAARMGATIAGAVAPGKGGKVAGQVSDILNRVDNKPEGTSVAVTGREVIEALRELDERVYGIEKALRGQR
jgi:hypothetical protein